MRAALPKGVVQTNGKIKIATTFDAEVFKDICDRAEKEKKSFSEVVNETAKLGLFDLAEAGE